MHTLHFRLKKADPALNAKIFRLVLEGISLRRIARLLYISEHCVRIRLERLSQQALVFHSQLLSSWKISEPICFDGLENFAISQYDVNNLQQALGYNSLFIYDFNLATMNRKGRMSDWQKRRRRQIEDTLGRYNPSAIRVATKAILERLHNRSEPGKPFQLLSDEHFQYRRAIRQDLCHLEFKHETISSKACRNFQNILFSVNHADLVIRQQVAAFSRETIAFSKTHAVMCQKYALFMIFKNYMAPQFTKEHVRRPEAHKKSPAQHLGIVKKLLQFEDIFHRLPKKREVEMMNDDWRHFAQRQIPKAYERDRRFCKKQAA